MTAKSSVEFAAVSGKRTIEPSSGHALENCQMG